MPADNSLESALKSGQHEKAERLLKRHLAKSPLDADAQYNLGVILAASGRAPEAVRHLRRAAQIAPQSAENRLALAGTLSALGQRAEARREYEAAVKLSPNDINVRNNYAAFLQDLGDIEGAITHYQTGLATAPNNPVLSFNLALALEKAGRTAEAFDVAWHCLVGDATRDTFEKFKALARRIDGQAHLSRLFRTRDSEIKEPKHNYLIGRLLIELGARADGIAAYHLWAQRYPLAIVANPARPRRIPLAHTAQSPSPRYFELAAQYQLMHANGSADERGTFEGIDSFAIVSPYIRDFVQATGAASLLDYGGGRGVQYQIRNIEIDGISYATMAEYLGVEAAECFDVGVDAARPAGSYDLVICIDVLEHIDQLDVPWVVQTLFRRARIGVFANIASYPAAKLLPNGENPHCTIQPAEWWMQVFSDAAAEFPDIRYRVIVTFDAAQRRRAAFEGGGAGVSQPPLRA